VAAKRSPILGYNHNVRYRGIVFHIQTEDSGIINPHVFSHLFHGGVIISTRKLVYDPGANDDAVKSLMQAQHKAVMKELRRGTFDDKIDVNLAGTPGLLSRDGTAIADGDAPEAETTSIGPPVEALAPSVAGPEVAAIAFIDEAIPTAMLDAGVDTTIPIELESLPFATSRTTSPSTSLGAKPAALIVDDPPPRRSSGSTAPPVRVEFREPEVGRAPTERVPDPLPPAAIEHDATVRRPRTDVSAAMRAIQVSDDELTAAGLSETAEIYSPAPPSAPTPPGVNLSTSGDRGSEYHVGRRATGEPSGPVTPPPTTARPPIPRPMPAAVRVPGTPPPIPSVRGGTGQQPFAAPTPTPGGARVATPGSSMPGSSRTPTPLGSRLPTAPPRPVAGVPTPRATPQLRNPTPSSNPSPRPSSIQSARTPTSESRPAARGRPASGGGVVVSRPAVIVGNSTSIIKGAPTAPTLPKVRRAREPESFGGDLISERSLDEVILAYLSEDANED
jgi:hypothetical protein